MAKKYITITVVSLHTVNANNVEVLSLRMFRENQKLQLDY